MIVAIMSEGLHHDAADARHGVGDGRLAAAELRGADRHPVRPSHVAPLGGRRLRPRGRLDLRIQRKIHHLVFALPPGGMFRHSEGFRTVFAADEVLYVLSGTMVFIDPEHGEVRRVEAGEGVFFRRDTWHHALSFGADQLRVLEFFAPPPATGTSSAYARTKDFLFDPRYHDDRWIGRWPMAADERDQVTRLRVLGSGDTLDSLEGDGRSSQTFASTEHLSVQKVTIRPGGHSDTRRHGGDASMHVLHGTLNVLLTDAADSNGRRWFELRPDDGFFVPEGTRYELRNVTAGEIQVMVGVAPSFTVD